MRFSHSLFTVSGLTVLSRIAGFVRDALTASILGAGGLADAFFVAQRLPNLFRSLFAEGAFSAAFVPLYTAEVAKGGVVAAKRFAGEALGLLMAILIPFTALIMVFMPEVMTVLAPGFSESPERMNAAVHLGRITFPYLILISLAILQGSVLNASERFAPSATAPILYNLVMIAALLVTQWLDLVVAETLAFAVVGAGVIQALWLGWCCRRAALVIPLILPRLGASGKRLLMQVIPGAIGAGAAQVNLLLSTILASTLPAGAISYLFYADRLNQLPLGIVGIAVATTLLPLLSRHIGNGDEAAVRHYTSRAIEFSLGLGLPAALGLGILAEPLIQVLFERGEFTATDTRGTAQALAAYAIGIPAFLLVKVFSTSCFARHDTSTPVKIAIVSMLSNVGLALLLLQPLQHTGIAIANSVAMWVNAALLLWYMLRHKLPIGDASMRRRLPRIIFCSAIMSAAVWWGFSLLEDVFAIRSVWSGILGLCAVIGIPALLYAILLYVMGVIQRHEIIAILRRNKKSGNKEV